TLEAASLEANTLQRLFFIALPQSWRGLAATAFIIAILSIQDIALCDLLQLQTLQEKIYLEFRLPDPRTFHEGQEYLLPARVAILSILPLTFLGICLYLMTPLFRELLPSARDDLQPFRNPHQSLRLPRQIQWAIALFSFGLFLSILLVPSYFILKHTVSWRLIIPVWHSVVPEYLLTIFLAALTSCLMLPLATVMGWLNLRGFPPWRLLTAFLLITPAPMIGIAVIWFWNRPVFNEFYDSPFIYVYTWLLRIVPICSFLFMPCWERLLDGPLHALTRLDGCRGRDWLWYIFRLECADELLLAWIISFLLCFSELGATFLVQCPGYPTLIIRFFTMAHSGFDGAVPGITLLILLSAAIPGGLLGLFLQKKLHS
ncbi:MAG: hypothetical protein D6820_04315, partial [Lentisphaerae bacterium]